MPIKSLKFERTSIALIVRGKRSASHVPDRLDQHADCISPKGAPVGFFGDAGADPGSGAKVGMGMSGVVYYYDEFVLNRPYYVDRAVAKQYNIVSTVLK